MAPMRDIGPGSSMAAFEAPMYTYNGNTPVLETRWVVVVAEENSNISYILFDDGKSLKPVVIDNVWSALAPARANRFLAPLIIAPEAPKDPKDRAKPVAIAATYVNQTVHIFIEVTGINAYRHLSFKIPAGGVVSPRDVHRSWLSGGLFGGVIQGGVPAWPVGLACYSQGDGSVFLVAGSASGDYLQVRSVDLTSDSFAPEMERSSETEKIIVEGGWAYAVFYSLDDDADVAIISTTSGRYNPRIRWVRWRARTGGGFHVPGSPGPRFPFPPPDLHELPGFPGFPNYTGEIGDIDNSYSVRQIGDLLSPNANLKLLDAQAASLEAGPTPLLPEVVLKMSAFRLRPPAWGTHRAICVYWLGPDGGFLYESGIPGSDQTEIDIREERNRAKRTIGMYPFATATDRILDVTAMVPGAQAFDVTAFVGTKGTRLENSSWPSKHVVVALTSGHLLHLWTTEPCEPWHVRTIGRFDAQPGYDPPRTSVFRPLSKDESSSQPPPRLRPDSPFEIERRSASNPTASADSQYSRLFPRQK